MHAARNESVGRVGFRWYLDVGEIENSEHRRERRVHSRAPADETSTSTYKQSCVAFALRLSILQHFGPHVKRITNHLHCSFGAHIV